MEQQKPKEMGKLKFGNLRETFVCEDWEEGLETIDRKSSKTFYLDDNRKDARARMNEQRKRTEEGAKTNERKQKQ